MPTEKICTRQKIYNFSCVYQKYRQGIPNFSVSDINRQYIYHFPVGFIIFLSVFSHRQYKVNFFVGFVSTDRDFWLSSSERQLRPPLKIGSGRIFQQLSGRPLLSRRHKKSSYLRVKPIVNLQRRTYTTTALALVVTSVLFPSGGQKKLQGRR